MKQKFEKNETLFCILLIIAYVLVNSYCMQCKCQGQNLKKCQS